MKDDKRKVALIGAGMVGMSYAYALLNRQGCDELVLVDIDRERAEGEAMDLNHCLAFAPSRIKIRAGGYDDCADADLAVVCAGAAQKPGESRPELLKRNARIFESIIPPLVKAGFNGVFLIAANPVDVMARITLKLSGFPKNRVLGSGTTLDTARLRFLIGEYFQVDPRNIHAYVIGEHGDSEFVPWSQAMLATRPIFDVCAGKRGCTFADLQAIDRQVRESAQVIIEAKKATYYGIGVALVRITQAIFGDENSVLTVSSCLQGEYGLEGVFLGLPAFVNRQGVRGILPLELTGEEEELLRHSAGLLEGYWRQLQEG